MKLKKEYKKIGFLKITPNKIFHFSEIEWLQFASLLQHGNTLNHALQLMNRDSEYIVERIQTGEKLEVILLEGKKGKFYEHLAFFMSLSSLSDAIYSAISLVKFEKGIKHNLRKQTAYPLFIFLFSFVSIFLFSNYIIPQLLNSFGDQKDNILFELIAFIKGISIICMGLVLILLILFIVLNINKKMNYIFYCKIGYRIPLCKQVVSFYLSGYLKELHECGLSSKESFTYMKRLKKDSYLFYVVDSIVNQLEKGIDLSSIIQKEACLCNSFKMNYAIGSNNSTLEKSFETYMEMQQIKWESLIKKISLVVQMISYSFVGILIICVYQIMLIPLQMLEEL